MNVTMNIPVLNTHMGYLSGKSIKFKDILDPYSGFVKTDYAFNFLMFYFGENVQPELRTKNMEISNLNLFIIFLETVAKNYSDFVLENWKMLFLEMKEKNKLGYLTDSLPDGRRYWCPSDSANTKWG